LIAISIPYNTEEISSYIAMKKPSLTATASGYIVLTIAKVRNTLSINCSYSFGNIVFLDCRVWRSTRGIRASFI
jgi:hypothetical protein